IPAAPGARARAAVPRPAARGHPRLAGLAASPRPGARRPRNAPPPGARALPRARSRNATGRHRGHRRAREASELVLPRQRPPPGRYGRVPRGVPSRLLCPPLAPGAHGLGARESATLPQPHLRSAPRRPALLRRAGGEPRLNRLLQLALRAIYGRYVPEP